MHEQNTINNYSRFVVVYVTLFQLYRFWFYEAKILLTGKVPGTDASNRETCVLTGAPYWVAAPEKSLLVDRIWAWISRPITPLHSLELTKSEEIFYCGVIIEQWSNIFISQILWRMIDNIAWK